MGRASEEIKPHQLGSFGKAEDKKLVYMPSGDALPFEMFDQADPDDPQAGKPVRGTVHHRNGQLWIHLEGYSDYCSANGHGTPILVEHYQGQIQVIIYGDINREEPTHVVSLDGARESEREEEEK